MILRIAISGLLTLAWLGMSGFHAVMSINNGGFSDGALGVGSYGNLIGFTLWLIIGGLFAVGCSWALSAPLKCDD